MPRIALDVFGGDGAPGPELDAAVEVMRGASGEDLELVLVGDEATIADGLARRGARAHPRLSIRHASQVITMQDAPAAAVRSKRDSSMRVGFDLVKAGEADAVVSAGNSGAMLACGTLVLRRQPGVVRPGIAATFPTLRGSCTICDMGANVEPRPEALAQFGLLAALYAQAVCGTSRPRLGLLSNGEEDSKGTDLTREANAILRRVVAADGGVEFDYVGYIEGRHLFTGDVEAVATDGFTGNAVLKTAEGATQAVLAFFKQAMSSSPRARLGALLLQPALRALRKRIDYAEIGGAPLLGVNGVAIVCHGRSSARALANGVLAAARLVSLDLRGKIGQAVARSASCWAPAPAAPAGDRPASGAEDGAG